MYLQASDAMPTSAVAFAHQRTERREEEEEERNRMTMAGMTMRFLGQIFRSAHPTDPSPLAFGDTTGLSSPGNSKCYL